MINTFYASDYESDHYSLLYIYDRNKIGQWIACTLNLQNNTVYTRDAWPDHILHQNFIYQQGDAHEFIKTLFEHEFTHFNIKEE